MGANMADDVSEVVGAGIEGRKSADDKPKSPSDSPLGVLAPFPYSPEPFAELSQGAKGALLALDDICTKALGVPSGQKLTASQKEPKPGDSEHVKRMKASAKGFAAMHH